MRHVPVNVPVVKLKRMPVYCVDVFMQPAIVAYTNVATLLWYAQRWPWNVVNSAACGPSKSNTNVAPAGLELEKSPNLNTVAAFCDTMPPIAAPY